MLKRGFKFIEYENRLEKVQSIMYRNKIDMLLITSEYFMRYFIGFSSQFWQSPTRPWFIIILPEGSPIAVIPSIGVPLMESCYVGKIHSWASPDKDDDGISLLLKVLQESSGGKGANIGLLMGRETSFRAPLQDILNLIAPETKLKISDITPSSPF